MVKLKSTYAAVSAPLADLGNWNPDWILWDSDNPYLYLRTTSDQRLLFGGEDDDPGLGGDRFEGLDHRAQHLQAEGVPSLGARQCDSGYSVVDVESDSIEIHHLILRGAVHRGSDESASTDLYMV